jgi:hypothetical protein
MIRHYFGQASVTPAQLSGLERIMDHSGSEGEPLPLGCLAGESILDMTPAQLEQQCAEQETVEGLLLALERIRARPALS